MKQILVQKIKPMLHEIRKECAQCEKGLSREDLCSKFDFWINRTQEQIPFGAMYSLRAIVKECSIDQKEECSCIEEVETATYIAARQYMVNVRP